MAATLQENFDSNNLDNNWSIQVPVGFSYEVKNNVQSALLGHSLYFYAAAQTVGYVEATTTLFAYGDSSSMVLAYNDLNSVGVNSSFAGTLGLRMTTAQGQASIYFSGGGVMGASISFPLASSSTDWSIPLSVYNIYSLQIQRSGDTINLDWIDQTSTSHTVLSATDPSLRSPAQFTLFLGYEGPAGDHTVSDFGWFDNFSLTADQIGAVPEPSAVWIFTAGCAGIVFLRKASTSRRAGVTPNFC